LDWPSGLPSFETKDQVLWNYMLSLSWALSSLRQQGLLAQTPPLEFPVHPYWPRDYILIWNWSGEKLQLPWEGPYQVLLTTGIAGWTSEKGWTCHTRIKWAPKEEWWTVSSSPGNTKITLKRLY
jgi:hypothetical protein